jgi:hypothetical protein
MGYFDRRQNLPPLSMTFSHVTLSVVEGSHVQRTVLVPLLRGYFESASLPSV